MYAIKIPPLSKRETSLNDQLFEDDLLWKRFLFRYDINLCLLCRSCAATACTTASAAERRTADSVAERYGPAVTDRRVFPAIRD